MSETDSVIDERSNKGPGRILVAVYGLFALAATGRSILQIVQSWPHPPLPYLLSALAAVIYLIATVALGRGDRSSARVALVTITIELVGVLAVGTWSLLDSARFHDKTVWSHFGQGYGFVPLVLPVIGLWWLRRVRQAH
ncbi:hypothetical protein [Calidifontibacter terrae]